MYAFLQLSFCVLKANYSSWAEGYNIVAYVVLSILKMC